MPIYQSDGADVCNRSVARIPTNSDSSLAPRSNLSKFASEDIDWGRVLNMFSLSSKETRFLRLKRGTDY